MRVPFTVMVPPNCAASLPANPSMETLPVPTPTSVTVDPALMVTLKLQAAPAPLYSMVVVPELNRRFTLRAMVKLVVVSAASVVGCAVKVFRIRATSTVPVPLRVTFAPSMLRLMPSRVAPLPIWPSQTICPV